MDTVMLVRVTTPDREIASRIAQELVDRRLCASVHVSGPIDSTYRWRDAVQHGREFVCEAHTRPACVAQVVAVIGELHPYDVPEILVSEARAGTAATAQWLQQTTDGMDGELSLSKVIMGTWQADKQYWHGVEDRELIAAVHAALDAGVTTFDTAEDYGNGHSEQLLGEALRGRRSRAVICSKVFSNHLRAAQVIEACHRTLTSLGTDYVDLYQIHWPAGSWGSDVVPISETIDALMRLRAQGKIRAIGVSNFNLAQLQEARSCGEIFSLQPPYSLFWRNIDREIRPWCEAHGVRILAYSPLGQGILTGRFVPGHRFEDNRKDSLLFQSPHVERAHAALQELRPIADRLGLSLTQLAIAWVIAQPLTHAVVGARNAAQIEHTAAAANVVLSPEDLARIDEIGRRVSDPLTDLSVPWTWQP
jgi:myo-inositol catabolism protein IolS